DRRLRRSRSTSSTFPIDVSDVPDRRLRRSRSTSPTFRHSARWATGERMSSTNARGRWGENRAALEYRRAGFEVIDRNWSCRRGEIDLILRRGDLLVFCEVKARARASHGGPAAAGGAAPQDRSRAAF
ncbi:MAG: YraN family protein, partial [Ilumatobacter sp.]